MHVRNRTLDSVKSEEGNDSLDTFIRQAIGTEPILPFSRTMDNPMQWVQLLHAFDQPDLPGWPLITPIKVQMQKCEKCSREFCSPINYRRHIRVHRRSLNVNKESHINRVLLAEFWDKLPLEKAKELVSFDNAMLKEIPGSSVIRALASSLRMPGIWTLPQVYLKAGSTLLDIIEAKPSSIQISSQELFSILDDASERTFLCAGTTESLQRYIFDREVATNILELKNVVASTCFLFEQQLVKAWVADKDAEALRCQKLLVEEEEAAQKRQAALLERKKQKKLRQKEQKLREQFNGRNVDLIVTVDAASELVLTEASIPSPPSNSCVEFEQFESKESEKDIEAQIDSSSEFINQGDYQITETQMIVENACQNLGPNSSYVSESQRDRQSKDRTLPNESEECTKKHRTESEGKSFELTLPCVAKNQMEEDKCELIIGSISITSFKSSLPGVTENQMEEDNCEVIIGSISITVNSSAQETLKEKSVSEKHLISSGNALQGNVPFSRVAAEEFLERRWKEAISGDHVELVLSTPSGLSDVTCS